jgi:hypothetical protein
MPDFKFTCPQCGQTIECDEGYGGVQINCPACAQAIVVPHPTGAAHAAPPAPMAMPGARGQRFAGAQMPPVPEKSNTLRNVIVILAVVVVLAALGAGGWVGYSKYQAKQALKKGNPAAMVATPSAAQSTSALDLYSKVQNAYTNLTSLSVSGTSVMTLDMSQLTMADVDPNAKNSKNRKANIPKAITNTMELSLKLGRPNMYCFQGTSLMKMGRQSMTNTTAVWSPGETNYSLTIMAASAYKNRNYTTVKDRNTALMSGVGQPAILAITIMGLFFDGGNTNIDKLVQDWGQTEDDSVNGQDCATITAKFFGQKLKFWISKNNYMILQSQITLGAPISDADIDAAIAAFDTTKDPQQIAKDKAQAKQQTQMMTKLRGTITDTYDDVEANPTLTADDFHYPVPRGVRLARQQF